MPKMEKSDASRIQSSQATAGKDTGKGSFASRAQSSADKAAAGTVDSGGKSGGSGSKGK